MKIYDTSKEQTFPQSLTELASAEIDGNYTKQMAHVCTSCLRYLSYEAYRAHGSLVDSGAAADIIQK
jgi:hypothetical protein